MDIKIRDLSIGEKREFKQNLTCFLKEAEEKKIPAGSVMNIFLQQKMKEININTEVKKETAEQYKKLFNYKIKSDPNKKLSDFLLDCGTKNSFDKTRSAFRFCIFEEIKALRKEADKARKNGNYEIMNNKTMEAYHLFYVFEKDFLSENKILWGDISYRKKQSKSKKRTMSEVSTIKAIFEDLSSKPDLLSKYSLPLAVSSLTGCRPAELMKGVRVEEEGGFLSVCISGAKVGNDRGQDERKITLKIETFKNNNEMNIILNHLKPGPEPKKTFNYQMDKKVYNGLRQYLYINHSGFSLYTLRHRVASELKKSGFDEVTIAGFLGHRTTRSQEHYGYARSGGKGLEVESVEFSNSIKENKKQFVKAKTAVEDLSRKYKS